MSLGPSFVGGNIGTPAHSAGGDERGQHPTQQGEYLFGRETSSPSSPHKSKFGPGAKPPGLPGLFSQGFIGGGNNTSLPSPLLTITPSSSVDGNSEYFGMNSHHSYPGTGAGDGFVAPPSNLEIGRNTWGPPGIKKIDIGAPPLPQAPPRDRDRIPRHERMGSNSDSFASTLESGGGISPGQGSFDNQDQGYTFSDTGSLDNDGLKGLEHIEVLRERAHSSPGPVLKPDGSQFSHGGFRDQRSGKVEEHRGDGRQSGRRSSNNRPPLSGIFNFVDSSMNDSIVSTSSNPDFRSSQLSTSARQIGRPELGRSTSDYAEQSMMGFIGAAGSDPPRHISHLSSNILEYQGQLLGNRGRSISETAIGLSQAPQGGAGLEKLHDDRSRGQTGLGHGYSNDFQAPRNARTSYPTQHLHSQNRGQMQHPQHHQYQQASRRPQQIDRGHQRSFSQPESAVGVNSIPEEASGRFEHGSHHMQQTRHHTERDMRHSIGGDSSVLRSSDFDRQDGYVPHEAFHDPVGIQMSRSNSVDSNLLLNPRFNNAGMGTGSMSHQNLSSVNQDARVHVQQPAEHAYGFHGSSDQRADDRDRFPGESGFRAVGSREDMARLGFSPHADSPARIHGFPASQYAHDQRRFSQSGSPVSLPTRGRSSTYTSEGNRPFSADGGHRRYTSFEGSELTHPLAAGEYIEEPSESGAFMTEHSSRRPFKNQSGMRDMASPDYPRSFSTPGLTSARLTASTLEHMSPSGMTRYAGHEQSHPYQTAGAIHTSSASSKVIYNVKFKRTHRNFVVGQRIQRDLEVGAYVKVEADRGEDLGVIVSKVSGEKSTTPGRSGNFRGAGGPQGSAAGFGEVPAGISPGGVMPGSGPGDLKKILRLATNDEVSLLSVMREEEDELLKICRSKVRQRGLPMRVVDAEYQYDRHKLTFFFEAEGRIDFRELVRDLFSMYKTRIWMQQIDKNTSSGNTAQGSGHSAQGDSSSLCASQQRQSVVEGHNVEEQHYNP